MPTDLISVINRKHFSTLSSGFPEATQMRFSCQSPIVNSTAHQMYSVGKAPREYQTTKKPNCKEPYYMRAAEQTTNNENLSKGFTKARRNTILAFNQSDNANGEFYEVHLRPEETKFGKT